MLVAGTPDPALFLKEFREGLRQLGYVEGETIALEVRSAGSTDPVRLQTTARELVKLKPNAIVGYQTPPSQAAKAVTHDIPIVIESGDPVGTGLIESLARPGGNVTGVSSATADIAAKNVQLLHEFLPTARNIGALCNASDPFSKPFLDKIEDAGTAIGLRIRPVFAHGAEELEAAFAELVAQPPVNAVVVQPSLGAEQPAALARKHRLAAASPHRPFAVAGGLLSYSANQPALFRRAATFVDRILKGARPADLPVEEPTLFDMVINLETASLLGLSVPPTVLARANEVIE